MRFNVVTLFPELITSFIQVGLLGKAVASGIIQVKCRSPREFTTDVHHSVDDTPYGGGCGMVMMPGPVMEAVEALEAESPGLAPSHRVLLTPQGVPMTHERSESLQKRPVVTLVCGRYQGFDERIRCLVNEEISIGDFVLNGGEIAAIAIIESVSRLIPGVIGSQGSLQDESHSAGLLEYPQYTRPRCFRGYEVPDILLSGNHREIAKWRRMQALKRTYQRRPDLFSKVQLTDEEKGYLDVSDSMPGNGRQV